MVKITEIDKVAGEIWEYLGKNGPTMEFYCYKQKAKKNGAANKK